MIGGRKVNDLLQYICNINVNGFYRCSCTVKISLYSVDLCLKLMHRRYAK